MKRIFLIPTFILLVWGSAAADWPLFHGDDQRTGYYPESTTAGLVDLWQADLGSPIYVSPVISDGSVFISTADARLFALDEATGATIWQINLGSWSEASPTVSAGRIFVPCVDHRLYCLDAQTGAVIWVAETKSWIESSPLVFAGKVLLGGSDHHFYAFDQDDGSLLFSLPSDYDVITAPSTDGQNIFYGGDDGKIRSVTPDGVVIWTADAGGAVYGAPAAAEGKVVYGSIANGEGSSFNRLAALDASSGTEIWRQDFDGYEFLYGTPTVAYGNVYIGDFQGNVRAFDLDDGNLLWTRSLGDWSLLSSPAVSEGVLYIGSNDGDLYALDAFTGVVLDQAGTGGFIQSSPGIAGNRLFVGSADGILRAFNLDMGVEVSASPQVVSVPAGGTLPFDVLISERHGDAQAFLAWLRITRPNGAQRDFGNPVNLNLPPGGQISAAAQLGIPTNAPAGDYFLAVNVGASQDAIWDASSFAFTITPPEDLVPARTGDWTFTLSEGKPDAVATTGVPGEFALYPPYPNPFNASVNFRFSLPAAGEVTVKVYDASGRRVATLFEGALEAGVHRLRWDASNFASGVYFVKLTSRGETAVSRVIYTR